MIFRIGSLALGLGLLATAASAQDSAVGRGEKVYAAQKCSICHSVGSAGNKKGPLDAVGAKLSADDIRRWMVDAPGMAAKAKAERKPAMKSYPNLPAEDLEALVAYLASLRK